MISTLYCNNSIQLNTQNINFKLKRNVEHVGHRGHITFSCCVVLVFFRQLNDHVSGKELIIRFTARTFRKLLSIYVHVF